jgi:hypothetical protein
MMEINNALLYKFEDLKYTLWRRQEVTKPMNTAAPGSTILSNHRY